MEKRAIILAGGKGTRLRPYTVVLPKPLMPVGEYPILEVVIRQLVYYGFNHVTLAVNHQAELIKTFFGDGEKWGIKIDYSLEHKPLGTMGPLRIIEDLPDDFLIMNGDILTDLNYSELYAQHTENNHIFTIAASQRKQISEYGVLEVDQNNRLSGFKEKPVVEYDVSMGVYIASKKVLDYIPQNKAYGFDHLMLDLLSSGNAASVFRFLGYWLDIGRPDDYMQAIEEFDSMKARFLP